MFNRPGPFIFILLLLASMTYAQAQTTTVRGAVTDAKTGEPLPFVTIIFEGTAIGKNTDFNGQYIIETNGATSRLKFTLLGYNTVVKDVAVGQSQIISVKMSPETKQLKEVTVKGEKKRYRNKDNPAVDLIRKVIDNKKQNRKTQIDAFQYEKYEKVQFALSNITEKFKNKRYLKNFQFIFDNLDSNQIPGKVILPMYLKETLSDYYYRKDPKGKKEIIGGTHKVDFDDFVNNDGIGAFIGYLYQDVDIYDNTVFILTNPFISPIADNGPLFYRYYIKDTVKVEEKTCFHMIFYPRNKADFNFQGEIYVTADSDFAVRRCDLTVSPDINLNFVKELKISQDYTQASPGNWLLSHDNITMDFGIAKNGLGLFGQRTVSYKNYLLNQPKDDPFYSGEEVVTPDSALNKGDQFWENNRHDSLTRSEKGVYMMVDSIQHVPAFRQAMNIAILLLSGYKDFGYFELGPVNTFYSFNPIEGWRARIGGRTTKKLSQRFQFETYAAYGFRDEKWKYYAGIRKAFGKKSFIDFPQKNFIVSYQFETRIPGQELQFIQEDNVLLSIKRGVNDKLIYNKTLNLELLNEFSSHFSYDLQVQHLVQIPAGTLKFNTGSYNDAGNNVSDISATEFGITLRYAPHEQFYQGRSYRIPMANQYPIFQVRFAGAFKDFLETDYNYKKIMASIFKRINIAPLGYTDVTIEGGKVFGHVPYPLLQIHRANQTYSYQLQSYNLMNFLEFISDQYVSINVDHFFNGFFFNKIPLFKKLKWREVASVKLLYGNITDGNDPNLNPDLFRLPVTPTDQPLSYSLERKPYIEASVGIANIFKLFRIDLIKRLTYLDHPNVAEFGLRGRFKFDF